MLRSNHLSWLAAAGLSLACSSLVHAAPPQLYASPIRGGAPVHTGVRLHSTGQHATAVSGYTTLGSVELERVQLRPYAFIPFGAAVLIQAPPGVSEADMYRALIGGDVWGRNEHSPLTVKGARLEVRHIRGNYEARITADQRGAAREIQRRVAAL